MQAPRTAENSFTLEELPENLTAKHIAGHLQITPRCAYNLMNQSKESGGIPSFKIGKPVRAKKEDYVAWFNNRQVK